MRIRFLPRSPHFPKGYVHNHFASSAIELAGRSSVPFSWIERSIRHGRIRSVVRVDGMVTADSVVRGVPEGEDDEDDEEQEEDGEDEEDQGEGYSE